MNNTSHRFAILFLFSSFILHPSSFLLAQPPALIHYQGRLVDGTNLVNGMVGLSLRLYNDPVAGALLYADSNQVAAVDGLYDTVIGDNTTFGDLAAALTNGSVWLEVVVGGVALSPRERVLAVPYAIHADRLDDLDSGQFLRRDTAATHAAGGLTIGTGSFLSVQGALQVYGVDADDNDHVFFDNSTNEFLRWNNPSQRFDISDDLTVGGTLAVGSLGLGPRAYNRFGPSNTTHGLNSSNDLLVTRHVEVDGTIFADGAVQIASGNPGEGKILTSDANGVVRWEDNPITLFGLDFTPFVPDIIDNTVQIEVGGVANVIGVVSQGPGYAIERIAGFNGFGQPDDESGFNAELPLVFESSSAQTNGLNTWYVNFTNGILDYRSLSLIVRNTTSAEVYRVNLYEMYPASVSTGLAGRTRYTILNRFPPNMLAHVERNPTGFGTGSSFNTNTDRRVEISGITHGPYPAITLTPSNRTLTLTFSYGEGGSILGWVRDIATSGTTGAGKRDMSVIYENFNGTNYVEYARTNFFGVFPIRYEALTLGLDTKSKERVVLSYDSEEDAGP